MLKSRLITTVILILGFYLIFSLSKSTYDLWRKAETVKEAQEKRLEEERRNKELRKELEFTQSKEFIEEKAREKLGLVKPGETVVIIPPLEATQSAILEALPNWKKWWRLFF